VSTAGGDGPPAGPGALPPASRWRLVALLSATFAGAYYSNVALVPLDAVLEHFREGVGGGALLLGGFAVTLAAATPLAAHLGERTGMTRALAAGVGLLALGSVVAALAPSFAVLVAARVAQGVAAAVIVPGVMILLTTTLPERQRPVAVGMWSAVNSMGRVVAVPVGGVLASLAGWSAVFWSTVGVAALAAFAVALAVPRRPAQPVRVDWPGAAAFSGGVALALGGLIVVASSPHAALAALAALAAGVVLLAVARRRAGRVAHPLVPRGLLRSTTLLRSSLGGFVQMATVTIDVAGASLYLVTVSHANAAVAGLVALALPGAMVGASAVAGPLMRRHGGRRVFWWGLGTLATGQGMLAVVAASHDGVGGAVVGALAVAGVGGALVQTSASGGATRPEADRRAAAVGLFTLLRFAGTVAGAAWLAALLSLAGSYAALFSSTAGLVVLAGTLAVLAGRRGTGSPVASPPARGVPDEASASA
jgi:MFS family permease